MQPLRTYISSIIFILSITLVVGPVLGNETQTRSKTERNFIAFEKWARSNGIFINKVRISHEIRGIVATAPIRKGDLLVAVPSSLFVNTETLPFHHNQFDTKILRQLTKDALDSYSKRPLPNFTTRSLACAIWLLYQKNGFSSKWDPWIRVLPTSFDTPLMLEPTDLELLDGSLMLELSEKLRTEAEEMFDIIERKLFRDQRFVFPEEKYTLEEFSWAYSAYKTRSFTVGLVPYADFFNHDPTMKEGNYYLDRVDNKFKVFASRDYNTGEEVMITYYGGGFGLSNTGLYYYYGFVVPHVAEDSVTMMYRPDLRGATDLNVKRHTYLGQWDYTRQRVYLSTSHEFDPRLLFILRLLHHQNATAIDLLHQLSPFKCLVYDSMPILTRIEMLREIDKMMDTKLEIYPEETEPIHENDPERVKMLKYIVESEKEILRQIKYNVRRYIEHYYSHRFKPLNDPGLWRMEQLNSIGYCHQKN